MSDLTNQQPELSRAAYDRLAAELEELQTVGRKDMAERLLRARELGDLSENAEYHETKNQQGMMEARIRKIEHVLKSAIIVEVPRVTDHAVAGSLVTLQPLDESDAEPEVYLLASSAEERARTARTVTMASPLGKVVLGKSVGDKIVYEAPGGTFSYQLIKVEPWDGQA
ncbi:MAG: transcription elongation factor GreA [Actinomycetota bacterium]